MRIFRWLIANQIAVSLLVLLVWTEETAWRLPGDASYDLLNYHLYGPFALLHGKWGVDLAPAQSQGFLPPTNDFPFYLLARHVGSIRALNLLAALPTVAAISLAFLLTLRLLPAGGAITRLLALIAVVIGATGAATHPVLATSMSDMIPCALVLAAMLLLCDARRFSEQRVLRRMLPGLLVGVALGFKLTFSCAAVALVAAILARPGMALSSRLRMAFLFCVGAGLAMTAIAGGWWLFLWRITGNPLFPLYNDLFRSPLAWPGDFIDRRFFPRDLWQWMFYPLYWAIRSTPLVTESDQPMRDPRMALELIAALLMLIRMRRAPEVRFASVFVLVTFASWERQFSIFRYLSPVELLSGTLPVMALLLLTRAPRLVLVLCFLLFAVLRAVTIYPHWGRLEHPGGRLLQVEMPRLPADSLVLLLDKAPLAYLALFQPDTVRFFGVNNNLTQPEQGGLMQQLIRAAIVRQHGHLYGLELVGFAPGMDDRTLLAYALRRNGCRAITGDIAWPGTRICALSPSR